MEQAYAAHQWAIEQEPAMAEAKDREVSTSSRIVLIALQDAAMFATFARYVSAARLHFNTRKSASFAGGKSNRPWRGSSKRLGVQHDHGRLRW